MVKLIGLFLIAASLVSFMASAFMDHRYSGSLDITGNSISNPENLNANNSSFQYIEAIVLSFSILSLIMGLMFLFRV